MNHQWLAFILILCCCSLFVALGFGNTAIPWSSLWHCLSDYCDSSIQHIVLWQIRLPRILVGFVAGMGLSCAGALLQNSSRNPLADPYLFGIVAGAGLGATLFSVLGWGESLLSLPLSALLGASFAMLAVFSLSQIIQRMEHLLLIGVAISFCLSAISQFLLYVAEPIASHRIMFWLMGSLTQASMLHFYIITTVLILVYLAVFKLHAAIDALALGDENAQHLGIQSQQLKLTVMLLCAAITAVIVAYCGGIAFIGLMIPHLARLLVGNNTLKLCIVSGVLGGTFLVWVDVIARSAVNSIEIALGVITSIIGSSFFFLLLYRQAKQP